MTESKASGDSLTLAKLAGGIAFDILPGRCETCKWWEGGICTHPSMHNISDCIGNGAAVYNDGYSCGDLQTGHKFGCIHHEAKPGKD